MRERIGISSSVKTLYHKTKRGKMTLRQAYEKLSSEKEWLLAHLPSQIAQLESARERQLREGHDRVASTTATWITFLKALHTAQSGKKFGF
jgi:hypothetical protein